MVTSQDDLYHQLMKKLELLEKISVNTKVQLRFISQRKLKGLLRLLNERAQYFTELTAINQKLQCVKNDGAVTAEKIVAVKLKIKATEQEIVRMHQQEMKDARITRQHIMNDLQRVRAGKNIRNSYDMQWMPAAGNKLNWRG